MKILQLILLLSFLKACVSEHVWHSYQYDPIYKSREELVITNIASDENFTLNYPVTKWKKLQVEKVCYLGGIWGNKVVIAAVKTNQNRNGFEQKSYVIDLENEVSDFSLFQFWNDTSSNTEVVAVFATQKQQLLWYAINETNFSLFWSWSLLKNISHIDIFQIEYDYHLLIINQYLSHTTADLYEFLPSSNGPNLWLRQNLKLHELASSSVVTTAGGHYFLAIPQKSLNSLFIYKLITDRFIPFKNISSKGIDDVTAFYVGHKSFLAVNGLQAGIFRLTKKELIRESIAESHLDGVNYWLPMSLTVYGDDTILLAQRILKHGLHKSFDIEVITYNGDKFEEHEDIPCFYFGEESLGLSCLADEENHSGIRGSVVMFLDDVLGLLIPRKNRSSELFLLTIDLRRISNPVLKQIEEFNTQRRRISELMSIQESRYSKLIVRDSFDSWVINHQLDEIEQNVKNMKAEMLSSQVPHYSSAIFNSLVKIESSGTFDEVFIEKINNEPADILLDDIVLKNNIGVINSTKTFRELQVEEIVTEQINNIDSFDLTFYTDDVVTSGDVFLTKPLTVRENVNATEVNGLIFEDEVINVLSPVDDLAFDDLEVFGSTTVQTLNKHLYTGQTEKFFPDKVIYESLYLPFNITVTRINGQDFTAFLKELCLKNIRNYIPQTVKVDGDVVVLENVDTDYLNNLKFPNEYVFVDSSFPNITGVKTFTHVTASEANCDETIDDIYPRTLITLSTNQALTGVTTFKKLKITESLNVNGNITGEHASKFLPNPTLLESNIIKSKVHFKNLQVTGAIIITENFNGNNMEFQLSDSIYVNEEKPVISGMKKFPEGFTVRENLSIGSNSINNISLDSIVTKDTEQNLNISTLKGVVTFGAIETDGLYNSVDVKKLDEELIKLSGEQYISSVLIFEDDVVVNNFEVLQTFKNLSSVFIANENQQNGDVEVENIVVDANVYGNISSFDLKKFNRSRMSFTENQHLSSKFLVDELVVKNMSPKRINKVNMKDLEYESLLQMLKKEVLKGQIAVKNFHVDKSIELEKIDNARTTNLGGAFWKHDVKKHNLDELTFTGDVFFDKVEIEKLSGVDFDKFISNIVFKDEQNVNLTGRKSFLQGFTVKKLIETDKINNVLLPNILSKHGTQEILGPVTIHGDVSFENNVTILGNLNHIPMKVLTDVYDFTDNLFTIQGDVLFNRLAHILHLNVQGFANDRKVQEVVDGIMYSDEDFKLDNTVTFENKVTVDKNMKVNGNINNINFAQFVSDMVMITKDTTIKGPVRFLNEVLVKDHILLHEKLITNDLNGVNLRKWVNNAIFVNEGYLKGNYLFENVRVVDKLRTNQINDINMTTLIPLRTQQNVPELSFNELSLFKDVDVGNSTNMRNLPDEFANSVLINANQTIESDIQFIGKVFVEGDVELSGTLNEIQTIRFVTTNTDQELNATYNFKSKTNLDRNLHVDGLVNAIAMDKWARDSIKVSANFPQNVTDNWLVDSELILEENCTGNGRINNIDFREFSAEIQDKRRHKYQVEMGFIDDYTNICKDLTYMYNKINRQVYKFNYLKKLQTLNFHDEVQYIYNYFYRNATYVLVNEKHSCESYQFFFDSHFRYVNNIHLGRIAQIIAVRHDDLLYIVTRSDPSYSTCKVQGTNLWQIIDDGFVNVLNIEDQDLLQESLEPGTFYGLRKYVVTEFKILPNLDAPLWRYRRWEVKEDNMAFVPRGLATGLALRTGRKLISLHRSDPTIDRFGSDIEEIIIGNYTENFNTYFPGRKGSDLVVMKVGIRSTKRNLLAVASHEETSVKGTLDFIKIYEDPVTGKVFHKVPAYKPSSLVSLEFNNGETLLAFMEDESVLQVYEYRGIEGFKHKLSVKLEASKLFTLSVKSNRNERKLIGLVDRNQVTFIEAVMLGNQIEKNLKCSL